MVGRPPKVHRYASHRSLQKAIGLTPQQPAPTSAITQQWPLSPHRPKPASSRKDAVIKSLLVRHSGLVSMITIKNLSHVQGLPAQSQREQPDGNGTTAQTLRIFSARLAKHSGNPISQITTSVKTALSSKQPLEHLTMSPVRPYNMFLAAQ